MSRALGVLAVLVCCATSYAQTVWQGPQPQSPVLPKGKFGLDFALGAARAGSASDLALFASARLPGKYSDIYGGRIGGAIQAIAIDSTTGRTFSAAAERVGAVPLSASMNPYPKPSAPGVAPVTEAEAWVNLDLRGHLGLPANAAIYYVFLWFDELTSPVRTARIPGAASAGSQPESIRADAAINWNKTSHTPEGRGGIVLQAGPLHRVYGSIARDVVKNNRVLTLLALGFRSRKVTWRSTALPPGDRGPFDFDPAILQTGHAASPDKIFIVATIGTAVSNVVTLP